MLGAGKHRYYTRWIAQHTALTHWVVKLTIIHFGTYLLMHLPPEHFADCCWLVEWMRMWLREPLVNTMLQLRLHQSRPDLHIEGVGTQCHLFELCCVSPVL